MKSNELRDLALSELKARLGDEKKAIQELRFTKSITGQLENPAELKLKRRLVARLHTIIQEKESAQ